MLACGDENFYFYIIFSCYAHHFFKVEKACHFERSEKSKPSRFLATLEMTAAISISEALCVTSVIFLISFQFIIH
jgi:hypothetical protein